MIQICTRIKDIRHSSADICVLLDGRVSQESRSGTCAEMTLLENILFRVNISKCIKMGTTVLNAVIVTEF